MPVKQQLFALLVCCLVFVFTIEMVRKKRLREEYSVLWLATSVIMFVLVLRYEWLVVLTRFIGAGLPTSTLFIGSIIFLVLIAVQFSIKISLLSDQVKNLVQENAILRHEFARLQGGDRHDENEEGERKCPEFGGREGEITFSLTQKESCK